MTHLPLRRALSPLGQGRAPSLTDGLLAYWRLEEASGQRADALGAYPLTDVNTVTGNPGKLGNAAQFTAANLESLDNSSDLKLIGDLTVSAWVYYDTLIANSDGRGIMAFHTGESIGDWGLHVPSAGAAGGIAFYHWKTAGNDTTGHHRTASNFGLAAAATWYHLVARRSAGVYTLWLNGVSQTLTTDIASSTGWGNTKFSIGTNWKAGGSAYFWNGRVDEVAIYNRGISDGEIAQYYNGGSGYAPV